MNRRNLHCPLQSLTSESLDSALCSSNCHIAPLLAFLLSLFSPVPLLLLPAPVVFGPRLFDSSALMLQESIVQKSAWRWDCSVHSKQNCMQQKGCIDPMQIPFAHLPKASLSDSEGCWGQQGVNPLISPSVLPPLPWMLFLPHLDCSDDLGLWPWHLN